MSQTIINQTKVVDKIVAGVLQAITEGRLRPGDKLAEQRLGLVYGVSRTIARQALHHAGRSEHEPKRGCAGRDGFLGAGDVHV